MTVLYIECQMLTPMSLIAPNTCWNRLPIACQMVDNRFLMLFQIWCAMASKSTQAWCQCPVMISMKIEKMPTMISQAFLITNWIAAQAILATVVRIDHQIRNAARIIAIAILKMPTIMSQTILKIARHRAIPVLNRVSITVKKILAMLMTSESSTLMYRPMKSQTYFQMILIDSPWVFHQASKFLVNQFLTPLNTPTILSHQLLIVLHMSPQILSIQCHISNHISWNHLLTG